MGIHNQKVRPAVLRQDKDILAALKKIAGYAPANEEYTLANLQAAYDAMTAAGEMEVRKYAEAATARDAVVKAEFAFHWAILGAKQQVVAQFGEDSNEIAATGLKRKSEIRRGERRFVTVPPAEAPR